MVKKFVSLLSADAGNFEKIIKKFESQGYDGFHFDIMDGHFVKNFAFGPGLIKSLRKYTKLPFQAHLYIENPGEYIDMFIQCGSDIVTLHPQTCEIERELRYLRARKIVASVAMDPEVKAEELSKYLNLTDNITVLSVYPGFGEQKFQESSLLKIKRLREMIGAGGYNISISVDGGVDESIEKNLIEAGADILIYGSSLFK